jgi:N-acylneuraminate cytidylyltransferase
VSPAPSVTLRPATVEDVLLLWRWRNDPDTRQASFDEAPVPLDAHTRWLEDSLRRDDRRIYIVRAAGPEAGAGVDAGMVRLDLSGSEGTVSINIAPEWRGKGVGPAALRAVESEAFGRLGLSRLVAQVKADNPASRIAFERAGFTATATVGELITFARPSPASGRRRRRAGQRLCIIPARGGSKRFPRKNLAPFNGTPLVARAIEVAKLAGLFDRILVSTDDPEIALLAERAGADVHHRDARLAAESARLVEVCHALLDDLTGKGERIDAFCLLIPPAPFRTPVHVQEAYALLEAHRANGVMSVSEFPHVPFWAVHEAQGHVRLYWGKRWLQSRDRLPVLFRHNGIVIWMRAAAFRRHGDFYCPRVVPYYMGLEDSVDIDHPLDLEFAEFLSERRTS